jgi:hypothetical protein
VEANSSSKTWVIAEPRRGAMIACRARSATVTWGTRWGAVGSEGDHHFVVAQSLDREFLGRLAGEQTKGGVQLIGGESAEHVGGDALAEADLHARVGLTEACEQAGDVDVAGGQERPDPDASAQDAAELVDLLANTVNLSEDMAGSNGDELSGLGWGDAPARAFEQCCAQLALEPSYLVR